ncbi:MAG: Fe-S protein assembly co-chaperone HscB [Candidatus Paracaedibacteraceae bacterium]|nr:Fe-S protein assembly co-chaperone HscB [Candidatus Paracaedibacteraceae bacterium]
MSNKSSPLSPFALLSIPPNYLFDWDIVNKNLRSLQETLHPDLYPSGSHECEIAQNMMSEVNNAYRVLKDPLLRAHVLFKLNGMTIPGSDAKTVTDPTIMEEALEIKEQLENANSHSKLNSLVKRLTSQQIILEKKLDAAFKTSNETEVYSTYARLSFCIKTQTDACRLLTKKNED